jgi:hypothetical protein
MEKEFKNINPYTTIASYDTENYKLSALLNEDGSYSMCSFEFTDKDGKEAFWDNPSWIYGDKFYKVIKLWIEENKVLNGEAFSEILEYIPLKDFEIIYEMLEYGKKLKFDLDKI